MNKYIFKYDVVPPNYNDYLRMNRWDRSECVQQWSWLAVHAAQEAGFPVNEQWVTRCRIIWRLHVAILRDWENAQAMFKVVGDGMRYAGILKNDNPTIVERFLTQQCQVKKKEPQWCEAILLVNEMTPLPAPDSRALPKWMQPRLA